MNPQQAEKLKSLIHSSPILNEVERQEWLQLLDLMNDKQVFELEKILASSPVAAAPVTTPLPAPTPLPDLPPLPVTPPPQIRPNLSHIVNLPKTPLQQVALEQKPAHSMPLNPQKEPPVKGGMPKPFFKTFSGRLQNMLAEKELPPGHGGEASLPAPQNKPNPSSLHEPLKPHLHPLPPLPSRLSKPITLPHVQPPARPVPPPLSHEALKPLAPSSLGVKSMPEVALPDGVLDTVEDVVGLSLSTWLKSPGAIQKKLVSLVQMRGYHEVLLVLEESPLYKMYIETGLKVLGGPLDVRGVAKAGGFEALPALSGGLSPKYLSREQFEAFTDLLRNIQAV